MQVHGAILRGSREYVVIKVFKMGIEDFLISYLNFMYIIAWTLEFLSPQVSRTSLVYNKITNNFTFPILC